jgi:hypothetical protein
MSEVLIVLARGATGLSLDDLGRRSSVKALLPPRIGVVADEGDVEALRRLPQVEAVLTGGADPIPASLDSSESTFVQAWQRRQQPAVKQRRGEGLSWDAEGYLPPDAPKKKP